MPYTIKIEQQVADYLNGKHPNLRRRAKAALAGLRQWRGDIRALRDELEGYYRLRVDNHRFIFQVEKRVEVIYAGPRSTVYETFEAMLASGDLRDPPV